MASRGTENEFITCPVCKSLYEWPLVMRCGHTFCEKCVDGTINRAKRVWEHNKPTTKFSDFPCPECNCKCPVPNVTYESLRDKFPVSWPLKKMADKAEENRLQLAYLDAAPKTTEEYMNQAHTYHAKYEVDATKEKQGMLAAASSKRYDDTDDLVSPKHSSIQQITNQFAETSITENTDDNDDDDDDIKGPKKSSNLQTVTPCHYGATVADDTDDDDDITSPKKSSNLQTVIPRHYDATGQRGRAYLSAVGQAVDLDIARGDWIGNGAWLLDPAEPDGKAWEITGCRSITSITQYKSKASMIINKNAVKIKLDVKLRGTGHVIWAGHLYSRIKDTFDIVKIDIQSPTAATTVKRLTVPEAGRYSWQCGCWTSIDLAVDEMGLWAIYGDESSCNIAVARIDPNTMTITGKWLTQRDKETAGNAFIISGILYVIDDYKASKIDYIFDTHINAGKAVSISIPGPTHGALFQACYIPGCSKVLVQDNNKLQEYPVTLVDQKPQWN